MGIKVGFITGARSEFGVMKQLILSMLSDSEFEVKLYVTGMHLLKKYGSTYKEIERTIIPITKKIHAYDEKDNLKIIDFTNIVNNLFLVLQSEDIDVLYIVGDRIEAYGAALVAHFLNIPIAHYAGGQITEGAIDNIYRYNISNLASIHFVTSKFAAENLSKIPTINSSNVHLVGSTAIDSIYKFLENPIDLKSIDERLIPNGYALMTFHPATKSNESIGSIIIPCVQEILDLGKQVLITYPNNDNGNSEIIDAIEQCTNDDNVFLIKNLGVENYYCAVYNSSFVIGNSSSGIIEVPYFSKYTINIGDRQKGRLKPRSVIDVPCSMDKIKNTLNSLTLINWIPPKQEYLYGTGDSIKKIKDLLLEYFKR
ncbi:MAG: UDP-N-acetylglucosamine 2-epimerase [Candidatus Azobacteroides sp.]|nr:UDP-N-acetylglucosamine 2-epimerase [Candidatus Azobacteroides sp.]